MIEEVFIALGSNLGDRAGNISNATRMIHGIPGVTPGAQSSFYETDPVGMAEGSPEFINCVISIQTAIEPGELFDLLSEIEKSFGKRERTGRGKKESRIMDIDILMHGNRVVKTAELEIPHPRMARRRFVILPMNEISPSAVHPVLNKTVRRMLEELTDDHGVNKLIS